MQGIKTILVEEIHDSLKPEDPIVREATVHYMLYLTDAEELLKVKGFDSRGRVTYNRGFTLLSSININSDSESFQYDEGPLQDENVVHRITLDRNENILKMETYHMKELVEKWLRTYDSKWRVTSDLHRFEIYDVAIRMDYKLDNEGRIIQSILYDLDGEEEKVTNFVYQGEQLKETTILLRGISGLYPSIRREYYHDKDGNIVEEKEFYYPDILISTARYFYKNGHLIKKEESKHVSSGINPTTVFHYDDDGYIIIEEGYENDIFVYRKEFHYDDKKRLIHQIISNEYNQKMAEIEYDYLNKKCEMPEVIIDFLHDRFYLDLKNGMIAKEKGFSKMGNEIFQYSLIYEYDTKGFLVRVRKQEVLNEGTPEEISTV